MNLLTYILCFLAIAVVFWCIARQSLAIEDYRATQTTPVMPAEEPTTPRPAPEVERHISWTLDTDEFEQVHMRLLDDQMLRDQQRWAQAREWLGEILVDVRDEMVAA